MKGIWKWFVKKASIKKKLIISYMALVLIPILILGCYSFYTANQNLLDQTDKTMSNNLERMVSELNSKFEREQDFTKYLAYNLEFREVLEDKAYDSSAIAQSLNKTVEPVLWYFITSDEHIKGIHIISPYVTDDIGSFLKAARENMDKEWYQEHTTNFNTRWTLEEEKLFATRTILDTATSSKMIGILRTEFYPGRMLQPLDTMNYLDNGILLLDKEGQVVYSREMENKDLQESIALRIKAGEINQDQNTDAYILKTAHMEYTDWDIYYFLDKSMIVEQSHSIISSTLLMVAVCVLLIVTLMSIVSTVISRRILNLKGQAEKIAGGDLDNPIFTEDTDEVGIVTNSLGKMTVQLNEMINRVYKIELEKKASELKALQAQMNPHFLYNCLSSIKWRALHKGDDDIADIAGLIARFYRTALNNGEQITTVKNELENIASYVEIQKKMHDGGFFVEYRLDEEGQECSMPNFLLQPVVENAIKHGIDYIEDGSTGKVIIEYQKRLDALVFNIYNNGPLIPSGEMDHLINKQGKGYGIRNIAERLELYYGNDHKFGVAVMDEIYTCFTIRIPDQLKTDDNHSE
ncbi:MAG: histidine kinase [Lachnospiraceae bacterium]|nr:histidine kinase [Lachnospiraceae bacterium]